MPKTTLFFVFPSSSFFYKLIIILISQLLQLADNEAKKSNKNLLSVKKTYVYGAKLIEMHRKTLGSGESTSLFCG